MSIINNLYSKREKEARGEIPKTYSYEITNLFKHRLYILLEEYNETYYTDRNINYYLDDLLFQIRKKFISNKICDYSKQNKLFKMASLKGFIDSLNNTVDILDLVEIICRFFKSQVWVTDEINSFFSDEYLGYKYINNENGCIIRIEDELFYSQCIEKTLSILSTKEYKKVVDFYILSYKKLSEKDYLNSILNSCLSLETLLKIRFSKIGVDAGTKTLYQLLQEIKNHIDCNYNFNKFIGLIEEVGLARNKNGGHLEMTESNIPPTEEYCRFVINQTSANLLFLAEVEMKQDDLQAK